MNLEEKVENSAEEGFFNRLSKRRWLRRSVLPFATAASVFLVSERAKAEQLDHDPLLLIHGLEIGSDGIEEYADFNGNKVVDFEDFFQFSDRFGAKEGDEEYDRGFDINRDGNISLEDFFIFADNFNTIIDNPLNPLDGPLESTWGDLSIALNKDLGWIDGGTIGKWVPENKNLADFYKLRLSSGNKLNFNEQGEEVKLAVDKINELTERDVILVGFSMGGLSARAYLQNNMDLKASALITICTPHAGSYLAYLPEKTEVSRWVNVQPRASWGREAGDFFLSYLAAGKPAINYLQPCSTAVVALNNEIHKMPTDVIYVDVISQLPNQSSLNQGLNLINNYKNAYQRCKQIASDSLLARGDGVVSTVSQLLRYAILNTNRENVEWYEKARNNFMPENAEMQVFHMKANKQTATLEKVLQDVIEKTKSNVNHAPDKPVNLSPGNLATNVALEALLDWSGSDIDNDNLTYTIYFEKEDSTPDQILRSGLSESEVRVSDLENNVNYYWQVVASDGKLQTTGDVWGFATISKQQTLRYNFSIGKSGEMFCFDTVTGLSVADWRCKGRIAFVSYRDGNIEIYTMNNDGSNQVNLTNNTNHNSQPSWSPDGTKIAFTSQGKGNNEIYTMNNDGSNQTRLTENTDYRYNALPLWSPDGTKIAFSSATQPYEIYVMNADGTDQRRLTNNMDQDLRALWSPDGTKMFFESNIDVDNNGHNNVEIYVMNADGTDQVNLTKNSANDKYASLSPDGTQIAFESDREGNNYRELYVMNADGTDQRRLINNGRRNFHPIWSPDGAKIVFASGITYEDETFEIYVMNADGTDQIRLTNNSEADYHPSWSPDGAKIAFVSERDGNLEIYVMNPDGSNQVNLTNNPSYDTGPVWSPR